MLNSLRYYVSCVHSLQRDSVYIGPCAHELLILLWFLRYTSSGKQQVHPLVCYVLMLPSYCSNSQLISRDILLTQCRLSLSAAVHNSLVCLCPYRDLLSVPLTDFECLSACTVNRWSRSIQRHRRLFAIGLLDCCCCTDDVRSCHTIVVSV